MNVPASSGIAQALDKVWSEVHRTRLRTRNGLRLLSGQYPLQVGTTPREEVWCRDRVRLYRYHSDRRRHPHPVLLAMSLVSRSYIFDLQADNSFVAALLERGFDVYVIDWGVPDAVDADNTLETYAQDYLPGAVNAVVRSSGATAVTLYGYCLGGVLAWLAAAAQPGLPLNGLVLMTTPVDFDAMGGLVAHLREGRLEPDDLIDETGNMPPNVLAAGLRSFAPLGDISSNLALLNRLADTEHLDAHAALIGWTRDHIPFPGGTMRQIVHQLIRGKGLLLNKVELAGSPVDLRAVACPVLKVTGDHDHLVPNSASAPLKLLLPAAEEIALPSGHVGLIVGRTAHRHYIPRIADWLEQTR